jgi:AcrR family transcriptional regulator
VKPPVEGGSDQEPPRERILHAAMQAFMELGYAQTSTLEIATRAQVSKRELYALVGNKQAMLTACIADRARRMQLSPELPAARDREGLAAVLANFGATVLREVCHPVVMGVFRLAIAEARRAPEVAQTLQTARQSVHTAVRNVLVQAQSAGLIGAGDPAEMSSQFLALLWGDLMVNVLLGIREAPGQREMERRAENAAAALLRLHPEPQARARQART